MFAIAFDLTVAEAARHHPTHNASQAYADIRATLKGYGFEWRQGSVWR